MLFVLHSLEFHLREFFFSCFFHFNASENSFSFDWIYSEYFRVLLNFGVLDLCIHLTFERFFPLNFFFFCYWEMKMGNVNSLFSTCVHILEGTKGLLSFDFWNFIETDLPNSIETKQWIFQYFIHLLLWLVQIFVWQPTNMNECWNDLFFLLLHQRSVGDKKKNICFSITWSNNYNSILSLTMAGIGKLRKGFHREWQT